MKRIFFIIFVLCLMVPVKWSMAENNSQEITGSIKLYKIDESTYPDMAKITFDHAVSIGLKECPGKLLDVELDQAEGYLFYELDIVTAKNNIMEILIDPGNGNIIRVAPEKDEDVEKYEASYSEKPMKSGSIKLEKLDEATYPDKVKISFKDAIDIVMKKEAFKLLSAELDDKEEYLVYEIKVVTSEKKIMEFMLDPVTGEVLKTSIEKTEKDFNEHTVF